MDVPDVGAGIDSLGVGQVHLLAHDWGSIQGWAAVTDDTVMSKVASFTSISGPHLNYAGKFLRSPRTPRGVFDVIRQFMASGYIWFFLCPGLPELMIRSGLGVKVIDAFGRIGNSSTRTESRAPVRSTGDYVNGLNLYRANMPAPFLAPGAQLPATKVPVQVLVPRKDIFVTPALQRFTGSIPLGSRVVPIEGGHWVVTWPKMFTAPSRGGVSPTRLRKVVLLPAPLRPRSATTSLRSTVSDTSKRMWESP